MVWLSQDLQIKLGKSVQNINRPYVVISNNMNNKLCPTINVACLTKQDSKVNYPMHVFLDKGKYGLEHNSVIYAEQVLTVNKDEVTNIVCSLDEKDLEKLNKAIYIQLINEKGDTNKRHESENYITHRESRISNSDSSKAVLCGV